MKTLVKRSIEQDIRNKIFVARKRNYVKNVVVKNQGIVAGSGWVLEAGRGKTAHGWKGVRSWVRLKNRTVRAGRSPKNTSGSKDVGRYSSFRIINGYMSFEKCWIGGKTPKIQRSSCAPSRYCKRRFRVLRSVHRTRIISIKNDSSRSHGYHLLTAWLHGTSSWRSILPSPGKNGRCSQIMENSQIGVSRHLDSSTTTLMA